MSPARRHKAHPVGHRYEMTPEWKELVRTALRDRGASEQWLATEVGKRVNKPEMKRDTINKMLRSQQNSSLVPHVCAVLGIQAPLVATPPVPDEETRLAIELVRQAPPEVRRAVLLLLQSRSKPD